MSRLRWRLIGLWMQLSWALYDWSERVKDRFVVLLGWAVARWLMSRPSPLVLMPVELAQRAASQLAITAYDVGRGGYGTFQWTTVSVEEMQRTAELLYEVTSDTFDMAYPIKREEEEYSLR